jgi:hypothetical protein
LADGHPFHEFTHCTLGTFCTKWPYRANCTIRAIGGILQKAKIADR